MDWFPTMELRQRIADITDLLIDAYHADKPMAVHGAPLPPVDELVLTYLSQSTTDVNSWRGFQALTARFPDWDAVADAPVEAVEEAIRPCGLAHQKAPRIQGALQRLRTEHGRITLDFLRDLPVDEARDYLLSFHGVGRKTASCVLLFSLGMPAMPVDTHVLRVARRLQLIPERATAEQAHDLLEALLPEERYYAFHVNMIAHGRLTCAAQRPACPRCPVRRLCPFPGTAAGGTGEEGLPSKVSGNNSAEFA